LDHRLAEVAFRLPLEHKISNGVGKIPLRSILAKYIPKKLIDRPKSGFGIPVGKWMKTELRDWTESSLNSEKIRSQGIFNQSSVLDLWNNHLNGIEDNTVKLWNIVMLSNWLDKKN